jgi:hypothetical protein
MRRRGCGTGRLVFTERRSEARRRAAVESGGGGGGAGTAGGGRRVELGLGHGGLELAAASWAASGGNENKIKQATMMHWAKNEERWNGLQDYLSNFIQGF